MAVQRTIVKTYRKVKLGEQKSDFDECHQNRVVEEIDGIQLPFIDLENLKKAKKASGRLQDLADIENLE